MGLFFPFPFADPVDEADDDPNGRDDEDDDDEGNVENEVEEERSEVGGRWGEDPMYE